MGEFNQIFPTSLKEARLLVIGLGLMGGSLALALRGKCAMLLGVDPDPLARTLALQRRVVDRVAENPAELLPESDLVVLATPVRAIISLINDLPYLHPGQAVVVDLGSTKCEIAAALMSLPERLGAVAGHPMCGKEGGSLAQAEAGLYQRAPFALVALPNSTERACGLVLEMIAAIGSYPLWLEAEVHDRWVAATSHLPYLLANALAAVTPIEAAPLVGPGFRSTARLAPAQRQMMIDILITNQENILQSLRDYRARLEALENALEVGDFEMLQTLLGQGANSYDQIIARADQKG